MEANMGDFATRTASRTLHNWNNMNSEQQECSIHRTNSIDNNNKNYRMREKKKLGIIRQIFRSSSCVTLTSCERAPCVLYTRYGMHCAHTLLCDSKWTKTRSNKMQCILWPMFHASRPKNCYQDIPWLRSAVMRFAVQMIFTAAVIYEQQQLGDRERRGKKYESVGA